MNPSDQADLPMARAKALFLEAAEIADPQRRAEFLDQACREDSALRQQVDRLLAAADSPIAKQLDRRIAEDGSETDATSDAPTDGAVGQHSDALGKDFDLPGQRIGPYRLLQRIGEGGMGTVFMAEQTEPIRRKVALKLIKPGMHSDQVIARFEAERQALALMDHPNIAQVLDAGTTDNGLPYFVMELVRGQPITQFRAQRPLSLAETLRLFIDVCQGVQHAHQKGIIHRDLKPSNVMVTLHGDTPVVKIIDFGVAKALDQSLTERTLFTQFGHAIGTPLYMSPEQAALSGLDVDTRSDVYSLGVLLYELLTGTTPIDRELARRVGTDELRRMIRETDPPSPSRRLSTLRAGGDTTDSDEPLAIAGRTQGELRGELDWITLKTLEKDRQRRYQTASDLADDVQRHLDHQPVEAGPASLAYRTTKWLRRNRTVVALTAAGFAVLATAALVSLAQARRAMLAERVAVQANADLRAAKDQVEHHAGEMQELLVTTLLEKGADQYNAGHVDGLLTLLEARRAAEGNEQLAARSAEFLTVAHHLLAGRVTAIYGDPMASAINDQGDMFAWCNQEQLFLGDPRTGDCKPLEIDPKYLQLTKDEGGNYHDILGLKFSPDGSKLALNNPDQGVTLIWDLAARNAWEPLRHERGMISKSALMMIGERTLDFCGSSQILATVSLEGVLTIWSLDEPAVLFSHRFDNYFTSVSVSDDGSMVAVGEHDIGADMNDDRTARVFVYSVNDPGADPMAYTLGHKQRFLDATFSDAEGRVIGMESGTTAAWKLNQNASEVVRFTENDFLEDLDIDLIHSRLAFGRRDGTALLVNLDTGEPIGRPLDHGGGGVRRVRFGRDGKLLITGGLDGNVQYWLGDKEPKHLSTWPQFGTVDQVFANASSEFSLSQSRTRHAPRTVALTLRQLPLSPFFSMGKVPDGRIGFVPNANHTKYLVMDRERKQVEIYTSSGKLESRGPQVSDHDQTFTSALFHPDGKHLVVCETIGNWQNATQVVRAWDIERQKYQESEYSGQSSIYSHVRGFINEREAVATSAAWRVDIVDPLVGESRRRLRISGRPRGFARSDVRQEFCIGASSGMVHFYDLETLDLIGSPMQVGDDVHSVAYTRDGKWLATVSRTKDRWNLSFWHLQGEAPFDSVVMRFPFSGSAIYPYGERGIVHQQGDQIMVLELPKPFGDLRIAELETRVDTGLRQTATGRVELIPGEQLRRYRDELTAARGTMSSTQPATDSQ